MNRFVTALAFCLISTTALAVPAQLTHQGSLSDGGGTPLEGLHQVRFALYDDPAGGVLLWEETLDLTLDGGRYAAILGADTVNNPLPDEALVDALYLELAVDGAPALSPRLPVVSVPFARRAGISHSVSGGVVDASEIRINGATVIAGDGSISFTSLSEVPPGLADGDTLENLSCGAGEIVRFDGVSWACDSGDHTHATDDIISGVFDIARLPVGTSSTDVAAGDHTHLLSELTGPLASSQLPTDIADLVTGWVSGGPVNLAAGSTLDGQTIQTGADQVLSESDVEGFITNGALDLAAGTTIGGSPILPSGMISMFRTACPNGWSVYTALQGRVPRGEPTSNPASLDQGGSDDAVVVQHTHTTSGTAASGGAHTHTLSGSAESAGAHTHTTSGSTSSGGAHTHQLRSSNDDFNCSGGSPRGIASCGDHGSIAVPGNMLWMDSNGAHTHTTSGTAASGGAHTHTLSGTAASNGAHTHTTSGTAASTGVSGTNANIPRYAEVVFCVKN